jgi:hypothetical protein
LANVEEFMATPPETDQPSHVTKPFPRQWAILIGADQYQHVQKLNFCGKDVRDLALMFRESLEFRKADVLEFTSESPLKPERGTILHHLGEFLKGGIKPDELLVFYFSGHGMIDADSKEDYLLPHDATLNALSETGISVNSLIKKLTSTGCKNVVMFIDACRETADGAKGTMSVGEASKVALEREGIVTFFSCDPRERSYEIAELQHGSFTHCLLNAIQNGECSTVSVLDKYLRDNVPLVNQKYQKPPQRPFTLIQPAEKAHLAIFYNEVKRATLEDRYTEWQNRLGDIVVADDGEVLDPSSYTEAIETLERLRGQDVQNNEDRKRLKFIEQLCTGSFTPRAFRVACAALRRSALKAPTKSLD